MKFERVMKRVFFEQFEHRLTKLRRGAFIGVDVQTPIAGGLARAKIPFGAKTVAIPTVLIHLIRVLPTDIHRLIATEAIDHDDFVHPAGHAFERAFDERLAVFRHDHGRDRFTNACQGLLRAGTGFV